MGVHVVEAARDELIGDERRCVIDLLLEGDGWMKNDEWECGGYGERNVCQVRTPLTVQLNLD